MRNEHQEALKKIGLSASEAQIYLMLLQKGSPVGASAVASSAGMARSSVYPALNRLTDLGLVEAEAGYGSGFSAVPPKKALPHLIVRETEALSERKQLAGTLVEQLASLAAPTESNGESDVIQVLRDPRVIAERFERLQHEAEEQIELFVKAPMFNPRSSNPAEEKAIRRGVRYRCLYESAIVDAPEIKPYLSKWIAAGEEARVHRGELPYKLALFDRHCLLLPLVTADGNGKALFIKHPQLATGLGMLFDYLWNDAAPIAVEQQKTTGSATEAPAQRNGQRDKAL